MTWLLDLDGVVWLSEELIPGSDVAIETLRSRGHRTVFLTNNSSATVEEYLAKLARCGIPTTADDLITSAQAAATLVQPGETALVCAGPGVVQALQARGVQTISTLTAGRADAVVVGWHRDFDFERLTAAFDAVRRGARLIGTNDDATYPTPHGPLPGGGSILAAVAYASGVTPIVAGKPHDAVIELLRSRVDDVVMMVGDRPSTDGLLAQRIGVPFGLVLSGVTAGTEIPAEIPVAQVADDLAALVDQKCGAS